MYSKPNSTLGKLLKSLTKHDDFLDTLIHTYLKSRTGPSEAKTSDGYQPSLCEAAARLLLVILPGLDAISIFTDNVCFCDELCLMCII